MSMLINELRILPCRNWLLNERKRWKCLAEEMRVLYVALTRAKEKLFLLSSVKSLQKKLEKWEQNLESQ